MTSMADFATSLLNAIKAPVTQNNINTLEDWQRAEGGAGPQFGVKNNTANFNPFNTTQLEPGATSVNSVGVKSYTSWAQGLQATVTTLQNGRYNSIISDLQRNAPEATTAADVGKSPWGTPNWTAKGISGGSGSQTTGQPLPGVSGGNASNPENTTATPTGIVSDAGSAVADAFLNPIKQYWSRGLLIFFGFAIILVALHGLTSTAETPVGLAGDGAQAAGQNAKKVPGRIARVAAIAPK